LRLRTEQNDRTHLPDLDLVDASNQTLRRRARKREGSRRAAAAASVPHAGLGRPTKPRRGPSHRDANPLSSLLVACPYRCEPFFHARARRVAAVLILILHTVHMP
jgi:hypothetical protein